ncbi:MAG: SLBB domain-containing protein [Candidatus Omnitrophota bacterium]
MRGFKKLFWAVMICVIPYLCASQAVKAADYTVGVDDILEINILQPEAINNLVTVSPNGSISFAYIGEVAVKDKTLIAIKKEIEARLADGYMKYPLVTVSLKESRSRKILVYGDVVKPGVYLLETDSTVLKAISLAGGFSKSSMSTQVKVISRNAADGSLTSRSVDIRGIMQGKVDSDLTLQPGDTVIVSEGRFFIYGEVHRPGIYPMEADTTMLRAISIAGGLSKDSSSVRVKILRPESGGKQRTIDIDLKAATQGESSADIVLLSGDTIIVSEEKFYVYGDVTKPGIYAMEGDMTVLKAITMAGGFLKNNSVTQIKVMRARPDKSAGYDAIEVDLKGILAGNTSSDISLSPGDTVMVNQGKFFVYGEVTNPGVFALEEGTTVLKAIAISGGFTKYGSASKIKILRPKPGVEGYESIWINVKDIMAGYSQGDVPLKANDTVVVFEGVF